jgi:hypothetical protein
MAHVALGLGVHELAAKAGVSPDTVFRLEKGEALHQRTGIAIRDGNVLLFCGLGNHVVLRRLPGGAEGIRTSDLGGVG